MTLSSSSRRFSTVLNHACPLFLVFTVSGGSLVAGSDSQSGHLVHSEKNCNSSDCKKKKVLVLGTGWAGMSFIKNLDSSLYNVQIVSPRNYFTFTPLLPSVTCGSVEARSTAEPIRNILNKKSGKIEFFEAECVKIDAANKKVFCKYLFQNNSMGSEDFSLEYDYLVIAVGTIANTFNVHGVVENCHFLKDLEDAQKIRRGVIDCFEKAVLPGMNEGDREAILHFVVVGGGPTGVEFAAELHDFIQEDLIKIYPLAKNSVKITLLQAADHILNTFDERISTFAEQKFQRDGIDVQTGCQVVGVSPKDITIKVKSSGNLITLPHGLVVWSTGNHTQPLVRDFMDQIGQSHRRVLATDEWLRVKECNNVYALGDCATVDQRKITEDVAAIFAAADRDNSGTLSVKEFEEIVGDVLVRYPQLELHLKIHHLRNAADLLLNGSDATASGEVDVEGFKLALADIDSQMTTLPATAQVAAQQGDYLSSCFNRMQHCKDHPEGPQRFRASGQHAFRPFRYKHFGQFAPLGGEQAAAQLPGDWVSVGHGTQWLWYSVYASKQVSWRTRMLVISDWAKRFIFGRDSSRI